MNEELEKFVTQIRNELGDLVALIRQVKKGWQRTRRASDDYYLDRIYRYCR